MKSPWKTVQPIDPDQDYVAVITETLPRSIRSTPALFRGARLASKQMAGAPGCVGFATLARPLRRQYRTISLWTDEASVTAYARSGDHGVLMRTLGRDLESSRSARWARSGAEGRLRWRDLEARFDAPAVGAATT